MPMMHIECKNPVIIHNYQPLTGKSQIGSENLSVWYWNALLFGYILNGKKRHDSSLSMATLRAGTMRLYTR